MGRVASRLGLADEGVLLREQIKLKPVSENRGQVTLLAISVTAENGEESQKQTRALVEEFITYVEELSAREFASTRQFLEDLVAEARTNLDKTETAILKWQEDHEALSVEQALAALADRENQLEAQKNEIQQQVAGLRSELAQLEDFSSGRSSTPPWAVLGQERSGLATLQQDVSQQRLKLAELHEVFTEESQQIREQTRRLGIVEAVYNRELAATVRSFVEEAGRAGQGAGGAEDRGWQAGRRSQEAGCGRSAFAARPSAASVGHV